MPIKHSQTKKYVFAFLVILQMIVIFAFSAQDATLSANTSHGFIRFVAKKIFSVLTPGQLETAVEQFDFIVRKMAHFTIYFILGIFSTLLFGEFTSKPKSIFKRSILLCLLYAVSDEIHQYFVPGRACRIMDVMIDTTGGALASAIIVFVILKAVGKNKKSC